MADPMSAERLAEIRADRFAMETAEVVELLAEVERLRGEYGGLMTQAKKIERRLDQLHEKHGIERVLRKKAERERDHLRAGIDTVVSRSAAAVADIARRVTAVADTLHVRQPPATGRCRPDCPGCRVQSALADAANALDGQESTDA